MSHTENKTSKALNSRSILDAALDQQVLSSAEAFHLLQETQEETLKRLRDTADEIRQRQTGDAVLYTTGSSLFLTNLCEMASMECAYAESVSEKHAFVATIDDLDSCVETALREKNEQIYVSGGGFWPILQIPGMESPDILKTYASVIGYIHEKNPGLRIVGFSPDEVEFLSIISNRSIQYILEMFQDQGLSVLGGNGIEILSDALRQKISPRKATVKRWFEIAAMAYQLKLPVIAKIECGHQETLRDRVHHLDQFRNFLKKYPNAFPCLIPQYVFSSRMRTENSSGLNKTQSKHTERLKLTAVLRLFLGDVLPNQQVFWRPDGENEAQEGLQWGANMLGSTDALSYFAFLTGSQINHHFSESDFQRFSTEISRTPVRQNGI